MKICLITISRATTIVMLASLATISRTAASTIPDGRSITPVGFTVPVEGFASSEAISPDGTYLAALSQQGGAVDVILLGEDSHLVGRLAVPWATGMAWTQDGLYVARGYTGAISRFTYAPGDNNTPTFVVRPDLQVGGLVSGVAEDPHTKRILVSRTASHEVVELDDQTGAVVARLQASGQPFAVAFAGSAIVATLNDSNHVDVWQSGHSAPTQIATGPHPTRMLVDGTRVFVADADGQDVVRIDITALKVGRRFDLGPELHGLMGQTPSGMALSDDGKWLFVAESGFNDVATVDLSTGRVVARIPTAWYPMDVKFVSGLTIDKDSRVKPQLYILSAQGLGSQPDPGSEWNGWYTGLVQHIVVEPNWFSRWSAKVASNNHFAQIARAAGRGTTDPTRPPVKHVIFIVRENKHFDEYFGDDPRANSDPTLCLYGRKYTPNTHKLAEEYTLFDNFMGNGEKSDLGHSWTTQGIANDYLERSVNTPDDTATSADPRIAVSIWPVPLFGEDTAPISVLNFDWFANLSSLPSQPRVNVSAVFGPRGELIDELYEAGISFRVYGEQMTMRPNGSISPGLAAHADRAYPGAHIDFNILDTERARLFLRDVQTHGLAQYSYLTLPTDHTAGTKAGFYTPASYVASNDLALGEIIAGLSKRPEWKSTVVFVTEDDPQGTGDHVDSHRMPAFAIGPYVRRGFVDHTRYSIPSILRTVEVFFGLPPLNIEDALSAPMLDSFSNEPVVESYAAIPSNISMEKNPGKPKATSFAVDGPDSLNVPTEEWVSIKGHSSLVAHQAYLHRLGTGQAIASDE
jgi:DNA-binding beta-propeller fold protein YncE